MKFKIGKRVFDGKRMVLRAMPFLILFLYWLAYYPGCYSSDSRAYWGGLNDHHPLPFMMLIRLLKFIGGGYDLYIPFTIAVFSLLFGRALVFFYKLGVNFYLLFFTAFIFLVLPTAGHMFVTYWKDILYGTGIFYVCFLLIKLVTYLSKHQILSKFYWFELFLSLILISGSRQNGIVVILFLYVLLLLTVKAIRKPMSVVLLSVLAFNFATTQIAFLFFGTTKSWMTLEHVLVRHLSVYYHERELDKEGEELLSKVMPLSAFDSEFSYYSHDGYAFGSYASSYQLNVSRYKKEIRIAFLRNLISRPSVFLKSELRITQLLWRPMAYEDSFRNTYSDDCGTGKSTVVRNILDRLLKVTTSVEKPLPLYFIVWSGALNVWICFALFLYTVKQRKLILLVPFLPIAGNLFSLFALLISQDLRYLYGEILVTPLFFYYVISFRKINAERNA